MDAARQADPPHMERLPRRPPNYQATRESQGKCIRVLAMNSLAISVYSYEVESLIRRRQFAPRLTKFNKESRIFCEKFLMSGCETGFNWANSQVADMSIPRCFASHDQIRFSVARSNGHLP